MIDELALLRPSFLCRRSFDYNILCVRSVCTSSESRKLLGGLEHSGWTKDMMRIVSLISWGTVGRSCCARYENTRALTPSLSTKIILHDIYAAESSQISSRLTKVTNSESTIDCFNILVPIHHFAQTGTSLRH